MSIWGNNEAKEFTYDSITYIAGLPTYVYEEFGMPIVNLQKVDSGSGIKPTLNIEQETPPQGAGPSGEPSNIPAIPPEKQKKLDDANVKLTQWANGMPINLSTTGGAEGTIRTAREDMGDFLISAIN